MKPDSVKVIAWPEVEPVTLAEAKAQCGIMDDVTEFDAFLQSKVAAARRLVERRLGFVLMPTQHRAVWLKGAAVLDLPAPPLLHDGESYAVSVTVDGVAVDPAEYEIEADSLPATITFDAIPDGKVAVEYWSGHESASELEPTIVSAVLAYVLHSFENRGVMATDATTELPQAFETLLAASSWNGGW